MYKSVDMLVDGMNIINIVPIELRGAQWYCVAFEPEGEHMGDAMHMAFIYKEGLATGDNLMRDMQELDLGESPTVRLHSECLLGDAMGSSLCDCGDQLGHAMDGIIKDGAGVMIYLRQEGRGIGMRAKLACLAVQEGYIGGERTSEKLSPDQANLFCGFPVDNRDYSIVPKILKFLNISRMTLYTGNPEKLRVLREANMTIDRVTDVSKDAVVEGSRKHIELMEKLTRNYKYEGISV